MIAPSIIERHARQALEQGRVYDETFVRGLLADIDRLRERLEAHEAVDEAMRHFHAKLDQLEQQKKPPASSGRQSGG